MKKLKIILFLLLSLFTFGNIEYNSFSDTNEYYIKDITWKTDSLGMKVSNFNDNFYLNYNHNSKNTFKTSFPISKKETIENTINLKYSDSTFYSNKSLKFNNQPIGFFSTNATKSIKKGAKTKYKINLKVGKADFSLPIKFKKREKNKIISLYMDKSYIYMAIIIKNKDLFDRQYYNLYLVDTIIGKIIKEVSLDNISNISLNKKYFSYISNNVLFIENLSRNVIEEIITNTMCYSYSPSNKFLAYISEFNKLTIKDLEKSKILINDFNFSKNTINEEFNNNEIMKFIKAFNNIIGKKH